MNEKRAEIATIRKLDGYRITKELGRVSARVLRPRNRLRDVVWQLGAFFGFVVFDVFTDAEGARRESVAALQERAGSLGADAVIGVRFRIGRARNGTTHVIALGRAVLLETLKPLSQE